MKLNVAAPLCVVLAAASLGSGQGSGSSPGQGHKQFASWDEVNLIAHGLLQLGRGLKQNVERTQGQVRGLWRRLDSHNSSLALLSLRLSRLHRQSPRRRRLWAGLRARVAAAEADSVKAERGLQALGDTVQRLLQPAPRNTDHISAVRSMVETQSRSIDQLLTKIKDQQWQLDKQSIQIKILQSKLGEGKHSLKVSPKWRSLPKRRVEESSSTQNSSKEPARPDKLPSDCHQVYLAGQRSNGVYRVQPGTALPFHVFCQMSAEGGWTVVQRRVDGTLNFDQLWQEYRNGFGNLNSEFWLGLEKVFAVAGQGDHILRIELKDWENHTQHMDYPFRLGSEATHYTLSLGSAVSGRLATGLRFSTRDQDHDLKLDSSCAQLLTGGWWFSSCGQANLNGRYFATRPRQRHERKQGIFWKPWKGRNYSLKATTMMIHPTKLSV